jgi:hypothetical protein
MPSKWVKASETTSVCCILNPTTPPNNARNFVTSRQHLSQPSLPPENEKEMPKVKAKGEEKGTVFPPNEPHGKRVQPQAPIQKEKERDEDEEVAKTSPALIVTKQVMKLVTASHEKGNSIKTARPLHPTWTHSLRTKKSPLNSETMVPL